MAYQFRQYIMNDQMEKELREYGEKGKSPDRFIDFLTAVLSNDLLNTMLLAINNDDILANLPAIVAFAYNELPSGCWGSRQRVREWLALHAPKGEN